MVDVLLVLLLFFMATATTEVLERPKDLTLPSAANSQPIEKDQGQLVLHLARTSGNSIKFEGHSYPGVNELIPELVKQRAAFHALNPEKKELARVFIRADKEITFQRISELCRPAAPPVLAMWVLAFQFQTKRPRRKNPLHHTAYLISG